jgi:ribosomal protein S18 acetylase RimI-like enzyme
MPDAITVRAARVEDVPGMARVHVDSWGETYRGLIQDEVLDDPGFIAARERQWTNVLTDERWAANRVAVAEQGGSLVGIAMSGPSADNPGARHLYVLYLRAHHHGSGAGTNLLEAVIGRTEAATLWVADPNPRAQAFYRKHGFEPDGTDKVEEDLRELHMVRRCGVL